MTSQRPSVCAVVATHNRCETTLRCLRSLLSAAGSVDLSVVHVDDASTDGTAGAVRALIEDVVQVRGDGELYWAGAMRIGLERAEELDPDHVLWLNDDVVLDPDALDELLELVPTPDALVIAAGALRDPRTGVLSYAAVRRRATWHGRIFEPVPPGSPEVAEAMNGNLVLVPRAVRRLVGNFDPAYRHAVADFDYGLRAVERGVRIVSSRRTVGTCARNDDRGTWRDTSLPRRERLRLLNAPTGRPFREWSRFQRRNGGNWPVAALSPYVRSALAPVRRPGPDRDRVAIVYKSLPHYRVPLYERLREVLDDAGVELRVLIGDPPVGEAARRDTARMDWVEPVPQRQWRVGGRSLVQQRLLRRVHDCDLVVVEQASRLLVNNLLAIWRRLGGPRLGLWGHGVNRDGRNRSRLGEWWKRRVITNCDWWFAYTSGTRDLVVAAGFPADRTTDLRNATDTTALREAAETPEFRAARAGSHAPTVAFVGSLYAGKGLDDLITTADRVRDQVPDVEFVIIGEGEDRMVLDRAAAIRPWFHVLGGRTGADLAPALATADCVVCPAAVGLVVLDAFALGLPVITAQADNHGPEIDYVEDGVNGLVVPVPASDPAYAQAVIRVLTETDLRERLVAGCRTTSTAYTIEDMAERFADGILRCLGRR